MGRMMYGSGGIKTCIALSGLVDCGMPPHLLAAKLAAGRPQNLIDIKELTRSDE